MRSWGPAITNEKKPNSTIREARQDPKSRHQPLRLQKSWESRAEETQSPRSAGRPHTRPSSHLHTQSRARLVGSTAGSRLSLLGQGLDAAPGSGPRRSAQAVATLARGIRDAPRDTLPGQPGQDWPGAGTLDRWGEQGQGRGEAGSRLRVNSPGQ